MSNIKDKSEDKNIFLLIGLGFDFLYQQAPGTPIIQFDYKQTTLWAVAKSRENIDPLLREATAPQPAHAPSCASV